jgi:hypothetical protein
LSQTGYLISLGQNLPIDKQGRPLAFLNYPTLALLSKRLKDSFRVLEFGSGYSTAFFSSLVREVVAVEHDSKWLGLVRSLTEGVSNVQLVQVPLGPKYTQAAADVGGTFQIILIDGRMRVECALQSLPFLASDGVIIWDDSARHRYQDGIENIAMRGFRVLRIEGLKPAGLGIDETAILYRDHNCLNL